LYPPTTPYKREAHLHETTSDHASGIHPVTAAPLL